ncbi:MAG: peroxiredoxin, partial [Gammaproteobacteria bacterium]
YRGGWVALYFYPKDDTPGCTVEACGFRDAVPALRAMGVEVLGVSTDGVENHGKFADKFSLPFPLLADPGGLTARCYGSLRSLGPLKVAKRHTFLIDPGGRVAKIYRKVKPDEHGAQVIADISKLRAS